MEYAKKIVLCEVGLRDGLQSEKSGLTTDQKVELAEDMAAGRIPGNRTWKLCEPEGCSSDGGHR